MFGNVRFVWNQMLAMAKARYKNNPNSCFIGEYGMNYMLIPLKQQYPFLKRSDSSSLRMVNKNLEHSFRMLFKHQGGQPKFKSRHTNRQSYTGNMKTIKVIGKRYIRLPKIGFVKVSNTTKLENCEIKLYTVILEPTGKYYLSLQVEDREIQPLSKTGRSVGLDVGIANLAISSDGTKYNTFSATRYEQEAINWQRKYEKRKYRATVAMRQWNHNHKDIKMELDDYQNWQRARITKSRYQQKIANKRKDYLHKLTTSLVRQYDVIVIEDLKIKNLQKNHHLAKSIANASWYQFRTMLEYKCNWYGKKLIVVKPNYTSQICSNCGFHSGKKPLDIREWMCSKCGVHHDRDINAAINILNKGLKQAQPERLCA